MTPNPDEAEHEQARRKPRPDRGPDRRAAPSETAWTAAVPVVACLAGAAGVALGAVAAHLVAEPRLATASAYLIAHAVAVLSLGGQRRSSRLHFAAQILLLAGTVLFSGTLAAGSLLSVKLSPSPAPFGGMLIIAGWLAAAAGFAWMPKSATR